MNINELPIDDLPIYQILFEIEFSKEIIKERIILYCKAFRNDIEKIQKCKFKELDNIFSKDPINIATYLLEWLKFNFIYLQEENNDLNKYYGMDEIELSNEYMRFWEVYNSEKEFVESFNDEKREYERHKKIRKIKNFIIHRCKSLIEAIRIKDTKFIPETIERLSFPKEYAKFKIFLSKMIEYQIKTGKHTFWKGNISKQFLKWNN